jgi:predicted nucleotidyltransferase
MTREEVIGFLSLHKQELSARSGVTKLGLAGSYARGEATEESDIDVIVEIQSDNKFRSFFNLLYFLEDALHRKIDLATESSLKPLVRERILQDIHYV